jgi:hypothetical protein
VELRLPHSALHTHLPPGTTLNPKSPNRKPKTAPVALRPPRAPAAQQGLIHVLSPEQPTQIGSGDQTGMARSAVWSRFLTLRLTKNVHSDSENFGVACLTVVDRLLTQDMSNDPPSRSTLASLSSHYIQSCNVPLVLRWNNATWYQASRDAWRKKEGERRYLPRTCQSDTSRLMVIRHQ